MKVNGCRKGKQGEREAAKLLTRLGFPCRRLARNGLNTHDLKFNDGVLDHVSIEVKHSKSIKLGTAALMKALAQSEVEASKRPHCFGVVLWFEARRGWRLTFRHRTGSDSLGIMGVLTVFRDMDIHGVLTATNGIGIRLANIAREQAQLTGLPVATTKGDGE